MGGVGGGERNRRQSGAQRAPGLHTQALPWGATAQNHTRQRSSEYCGDRPRNHKKDLLPPAISLILGPEINLQLL